MTVVGEAGKIAVSDAGAILRKPQPGGEASPPLLVRSWQWEGIAAGIAERLAAVETGDSVSCPPESAREVLAVPLAILASQREGGRCVALAELG